VVSNGRVGSNPTPRANKPQDEALVFEEISDLSCEIEEISVFASFSTTIHSHPRLKPVRFMK
jgi:hypothetical protein